MAFSFFLSLMMDSVPVRLHWALSYLGTSITLCAPHGDVNLSSVSAMWIITSPYSNSLMFPSWCTCSFSLLELPLPKPGGKRMVERPTSGMALSCVIVWQWHLNVLWSPCELLAGYFDLQYIYEAKPLGWASLLLT